MSNKTPFDQERYWVDRHETYRNDPRSVGNLAATREQNEAGEREFQETLSAAAAWLPIGSVLDVGCGYGRAAGPFLQRGFMYTGLDVSPIAVEKARKTYPDARFMVTGLLDWEPTEKFDLVMVLYVLVHFVDDADWERMLERTVAALNPGGMFLLADHFPSERQATVAHVVSRPLSDYDAVLKRLGMRWESGMNTWLNAQMPKSGLARHFRLAVKN